MAERLVIGLTADTVEILEGIAARRGFDKIEVVRRALALYMLIDDWRETSDALVLSITDGRQIIDNIAAVHKI